MLRTAIPLRLTQFAVAASLPVAGMVAISLVHRQSKLPLTIELLSLSGMVAALLSEQRLENGLAAGDWSSDQTEEARRWIQSRAVTCIWAALGVLLLSDILEIALIPRHFGSADMLTVPLLVIPRLHKLLTPPRPASAGILWKQDLSPIHSDHWGEQPNSTLL